MDCHSCGDHVPHGSLSNSCRECRWTGCQLIAERETESWPCPLALTLDSHDAKEAAFVVLGIADSRGLLHRLLATYPLEESAKLDTHYRMQMLTRYGMAVTDGAGVRA